MKSKLHRALLAGIEALESVGSPYAVVGGLAVSAWATPRATQDVDLYAELPDAAHPSLERALRERGFDVPAMEEELERFGVFRSRSHDHVFLDIFPAVGPLGEVGANARRHHRHRRGVGAHPEGAGFTWRGLTAPEAQLSTVPSRISLGPSIRRKLPSSFPA